MQKPEGIGAYFLSLLVPIVVIGGGLWLILHRDAVEAERSPLVSAAVTDTPVATVPAQQPVQPAPQPATTRPPQMPLQPAQPARPTVTPVTPVAPASPVSTPAPVTPATTTPTPAATAGATGASAGTPATPAGTISGTPSPAQPATAATQPASASTTQAPATPAPAGTTPVSPTTAAPATTLATGTAETKPTANPWKDRDITGPLPAPNVVIYAKSGIVLLRNQTETVRVYRNVLIGTGVAPKAAAPSVYVSGAQDAGGVRLGSWREQDRLPECHIGQVSGDSAPAGFIGMDEADYTEFSIALREGTIIQVVNQ